MKRITILALVLSSFTLAACGGGGSSPEDDVTDTVNQILEAKETEQAEVVCNELVTQKFLTEVYKGDIEKCSDQPLTDDSELENPGEDTIESIEIEGDAATVVIRTVGGDVDGAGGSWKLVDEDGTWKLDRFEDDYLRSAFSSAIAVVDEGVLSHEPMRDCMAAQVAKLKSPELRSFMFEVLRNEDKKATNSVLAIAKACPKPMAEFVADELANRVIGAEGGSPGQVNCVRKALVPLLMLTDLSSMALNDDGTGFTGAALAGLISGALKECPGAYSPGS